MNLLFEHMIRAETKKYICRIWRQVEDYGIAVTNKELKKKAIELLETPPIDDVKTVAGIIVSAAFVNSVEVIDRETGDGICVHKDWP